MKVTPILTHKITTKDTSIFAILDRYITTLPEKSIVAVTSKIVSICEGRVVKIEDASKDDLVEKEAELYMPSSENPYGFSISVKGSTFIASAGIDESNGNGYYVLWPENSQKSANEIREHLQKKHSLKNVGVIITDSKTTPLRWGVTGVAIAHSGFQALNSTIGEKDLFGRVMHASQANIMDGLAASSVVVMGERDEQTPLVIIEDVSFVAFQDRNPTEEEIQNLSISLEEDIYAPILKKVDWKKGQKYKK